jgi:hypothetical protein
MIFTKKLITIEGLPKFLSLYRVKMFFQVLCIQKFLLEKIHRRFFFLQIFKILKNDEKIAQHGLTREALAAKPFDLRG